MKIAASTQKILSQLTNKDVKLGDLRAIAKEIKKDHGMAMELWSSGNYFARQLSILIMDKKMLTPALIDSLIADISKHADKEKLPLADWLMANQLLKEKNIIALVESWQNNKEALKRRIFWYYQGRLRWMGQPSPANTDILLNAIEKKINKEDPAVQWAMNFTAGWIGVFDKKYRKRCVAIGEKTGLYKDEMVSRGCTPNYLPEFIDIEAGKRKL